jgi:hypothetical protein
MSKKTSTGPSKDASLLPYEYIRSALQLGLERGAELGVNPFKFGVIGSTDSHTGLTTIEGKSYVARSNVIETAHPHAGRLRQARNAARFEATVPEIRYGAPHLGEHTAEVLAELGYDEDRLGALAQDGVVSVAEA